MNAFFARLQEPSTHAALASLAGVASTVAVANGVDPHTVAAVGGVASAIFGLLGVFLGEKSAPAAQ
ncbi:hypothetical protein M3A49_40845 [Paraburkholderia sp. CNPSo 3076]|uniref:hypothetical protein n=1 Tax=Paraburkholderia sp. CNPSo 3076 TaxID=2940936 RepID=UPI00225B2AB8|nr:hypothetical protein [Paraburkholderia sp. CNPSo 3076]MCX5545696.1 hypothetical protein [Paraburkholderia sp. CNPSo 3076]